MNSIERSAGNSTSTTNSFSGSGSSDFRRQTAYKCSIGDIAKGIFVKKQGWESSYVMTDYGNFSRVNIIAVVVSKEGNAITLDDGTGSLSARVFDNAERLSAVQIGDPVLVIARPREFNNAMYLTIEIVKTIDRRWINYRKRELSLITKICDVATLRPAAKSEPAIVESESTTNAKEHILRLISGLDTGQGSSIEDVIRLAKIKNADIIIEDMLLRGEIFEIKAGKVKLM